MGVAGVILEPPLPQYPRRLGGAHVPDPQVSLLSVERMEYKSTKLSTLCGSLEGAFAVWVLMFDNGMVGASSTLRLRDQDTKAKRVCSSLCILRACYGSFINQHDFGVVAVSVL